MPNQIIPVQWGKPLRKSEVNTLNKLNEVIDFINNSDIHPLNLIDSDQGREVVTGTSTQLAQLEVFGESVQDGTPTPDNPVPVQVVSGKNLSQTNDSPAVNFLIESNMLLPGSYTLSFDSEVTTGGFNIRKNEQSGAVIAQYNFGPQSEQRKTKTITVNEECKLFVNAYSTGTTNFMNNIQLESGTQATPYIPYGCIGAKIDDEITPIDLQGKVLASLPDGTRDILWMNSAGVEKIDKRVGVVDLGTLEWRYRSSYGMSTPDLLNIIKKPTATETANLLCEIRIAANWNAVFSGGTSSGLIGVAPDGQIGISTTETDPIIFKTAMSGVLLYYELATSQTIELGTITPPEIPSGSTVEIVATLQPEFALTWFTEQGLPLVVDDLKEYIDSINEQINARIDELHGITRASVVREPLTLEPIALDPIEKQTKDVEEEPTEESEE